MVQIQPIAINKDKADTAAVPYFEEDHHDDASSQGTSDSSLLPSKKKNSFSVSFKFCIIATTSFLVAFSVIVLTGIWLASITSTSLEMSAQLRENEFFKIRQFCNQLIQDVYTVSNTATGQLAVQFNSSSDSEKALSMYKLYKSEIASNHKEIVATLFIADPQATLVGLYIFGGKPVKFKATQHVSLDLYYCNDVANNDHCNSGPLPDLSLAPFDNSRPVVACNSNPNGTFFLPSFADTTLPDYMFLTLIYCFQKDSVSTVSSGFKYLFAYQLSSNTLSDYLISTTQSVLSSLALVMEIDTGYVIATNKKNSALSVLDANNNIKRKGLTELIDPDHLEVGTFVYNQYKNDFKNAIACNSNQYFSTNTRYVSVYRMCLGVDWLLIYSVPIWNYTGNLVIAVVCAISGGLVILAFSAILGVILSVRIVAPFKNLIKMFNNVSNMDLDSLNLTSSRFNEVQQLQWHFMSMVKQIKLYRSFLPSHLLAQIDNTENELPTKEDQEHADKHETGSKKSATSFAASHLSSKDTAGTHKNKLNRFELYLEQKNSTALALHIKGLSQLFSQRLKSEKEILHALKEIFEITNSISTQFNGQRGNLENDTIMLTFNTSTSVQQHEVKAVEAANLMQNKLQKLVDKWKNSPDAEVFVSQIEFRIAVCNDNTFCGNVGTHDCKNFTSISCLKPHLSNMFAKSKELDVKIILSEAIYKKITTKFESRCIGKVDWLSGNNEFSLFPSGEENSTSESVPVFELGNSLEVKMDEWLYELEQKEKSSRWTVYNSAYECFEKKDYKQAKELFQDFIAKNPQDIPAQHMIKECESKL